MGDPTDALHAKCQVALIEFLSSDLDLAFATLKSIGSLYTPNLRQAIIGRVQLALNTIRSLEGRIEGPENWGAIHERADELEAALAAYAEVNRSGERTGR